MSLVAYYGSSEEESDDDNQTNASNLNGECDVLKQGQEQSENSNFKENPEKFNPQEEENKTKTKTTHEKHKTEESVNTLLKALPAPRSTTLTEIIPNDELEDEVKPKASQTANAPKPPRSKNRNPVKITIPTIEYDSDEDGEPRKKKQKVQPKSGKTGLTSILPPPIHTSTKETNRTLLPYVFTKKKQTDGQTTKTVSKDRPKPNDAANVIVTTQTVKLIGGYGSDSDDDSDKDTEGTANFFSLDSEPKSQKVNETSTFHPSNSDVQSNNVASSNFFSIDSSAEAHKPFTQISVQSNIPKINLNLPPPINTAETDMDVDLDQSDHLKQQFTSILKEDVKDSFNSKGFGDKNVPLNVNFGLEDAPLTFKSSIKNPYKNVPSHRSYSHVNYGIDEGSHTDTVGPTMYGQNLEMEGYSNAEDIQVLQQDKEFLRLQGKNQRGKEPIHFVEVNADDFTGTADYQKALSEETEYRSSHKKNDGPTSQQKRKHHITYLAHQAKERELELKNAWSQNKMTRKQTQAKYGF